MRALVQRSLVFAVVGLASVLSGQALAQATPGAAATAEPVDEVTVRGRKTLTQYRLELERAKEDIVRIYNEANEGQRNDVTCRDEQPTGSRVKHNVCRSNAEMEASARASRDFLNALFTNSGLYIEGGTTPSPGGTQVNANIGTGNAQGDGASGEQDAMAKFEKEWNRLLGENRQLYRAVVKYTELEAEYVQAGGAKADLEPAELVVLEDAPAPVAEQSGPVCEASTLTEYQQRNNIARVTGTVSVAGCPAGTTGSFMLVARVKDDNGETRPLEFDEAWQRNDAQDHTFNSDYPIGDNVQLMSVRVRNLKCTCADAAPAAPAQ